MSETLNPCPCCGATTATIDDLCGQGNDQDSHEVQCGSCQLYAWGETKVKAVDCWNKRVPQPTREVSDEELEATYADAHEARFRQLNGGTWKVAEQAAHVAGIRACLAISRGEGKGNE